MGVTQQSYQAINSGFKPNASFYFPLEESRNVTAGWVPKRMVPITPITPRWKPSHSAPPRLLYCEEKSKTWECKKEIFDDTLKRVPPQSSILDDFGEYPFCIVS